MATISWFAVDCNVHTHQKTMRLAFALKLDVDTVVGKLSRLWAWAKQNGVEDGNIGWLPDREISDIMRWKKKPAVLIDALVECGFLDRNDNGLSMHGWAELNGKLQSKKREDRERKRRGNSTEIPKESAGVSVENPPPTIPYHTLPILSSPLAQKDNGAKRAKRAFTKPSVAEIRAYCEERGNSINAQHFFDHYEANGWMVGKNAMKDWKAAVRTWERNGIAKTPEADKQPLNSKQFDEWEAEQIARVKAHMRGSGDG